MAEFVKGSVIVCPDCWRPVFALERGIGSWDRAGRAASAFRPLVAEDFAGLLADRPDVPAGWRVAVAAWLKTPAAYRVLAAARPRAGDLATCPNCGGQWVQFEEREAGSAVDKGYVLNLLDIPPVPAVAGRMRRLKWVPDSDPREADLVVEERAREGVS
jgi:hypothetical protein